MNVHCLVSSLIGVNGGGIWCFRTGVVWFSYDYTSGSGEIHTKMNTRITGATEIHGESPTSRSKHDIEKREEILAQKSQGSFGRLEKRCQHHRNIRAGGMTPLDQSHARSGSKTSLRPPWSWNEINLGRSCSKQKLHQSTRHLRCLVLPVFLLALGRSSAWNVHRLLRETHMPHTHILMETSEIASTSGGSRSSTLRESNMAVWKIRYLQVIFPVKHTFIGNFIAGLRTNPQDIAYGTNPRTNSITIIWSNRKPLLLTISPNKIHEVIIRWFPRSSHWLLR